MGKPDSSSTAHGAEAYNTVFVDTSIDTHLVLIISALETISGLKEKIHCEHPACFPDIGDITIHSIKVKRRKKFYNLSDSMFVKSVFEGVSISWFVFVDVSTVLDIQKHSNGPSKILTNTDDVSMPLLKSNHANLNDNKSIQEASPDPKEKEDLSESSRKNETSNHLSQVVVMTATFGKDATSGKDATGKILELRELGVERKDLSGEPVTDFALLQVSNGGINLEPCPTSPMVKLFDTIQKIGLKDDEVDDKEKRLSMIIDQKASTGIVERVGADGGVDPKKSMKRKRKSKKDHHLKIEKPTLDTVHHASEEHHVTNVEENYDLLRVLGGNNTEKVGFETKELISSGKEALKDEADTVIQNVLISLQQTNEEKKSSDRTKKKHKGKATKKISAATISISGLQTIEGNVSSKDVFSDNLVASQPNNQIDALGEMHVDKMTNKKESNEKEGKMKRKKHDSHIVASKSRLKSFKGQNGERDTKSLSCGAKDLSLHKILTNSSKAKPTASRLQHEDLDLVPDGQL